MSFSENTATTPDAATQALWRAAETGNVDDLVSVLPRVRDINARNEHGVTALMRAAQHGQLRAVHVLLERGADANIVRNDKFTALALAAFFGHTEVVRALMEHGADSQASTRHETSPHMWATARTFKKVVDELKSPAPPIERPAPEVKRPVPARTAPVTPRVVEPVSRAVARTAAAATVVRTLKDPPEIWDLVHPAPKGFNARSVFVARLNSMRKGFVFRAAMVVVLASVGAVGVWVLRGVQARSEGSTDRNPTATVVSASSAAPVVSAPPESPADAASSVAPSAVAPSASITLSEPSSPPTVPNTKQVSAHRSSARIRAHTSEQPPSVATNEVSKPAVAPPAKTTPQPRPEPVSATRNSTPLSPQLIAPVKSAAPKAKVIQWP
jgi:hypothetical protein